MPNFAVNANVSADFLQAALNNAVRWFSVGVGRKRIVSPVLLLAAVAYLCAVAALQAGPISVFGNDVLILLDGSWRIVNGQIPYRDFYLALGPLEYMLVALGMVLTHSSSMGIAVGNAVFGGVIGVWGWLLCRGRMAYFPAVLVTAWLVFTATSPTPLDQPEWLLSCAMIYNRHGYALLGLILVECAFLQNTSRFRGGVSSGLALILLAFLKLNFFGAGVLLLLTSIPLRREELRRLWGFLAGSACMVALFFAYLRFSFAAFFSDMSLAIHARSGGLNLRGVLIHSLSHLDATIAVVLTVLAILLIRRPNAWPGFAVRIAALGAAAILSGFILSASDAFEDGCHLAPLWVLILIALLASEYPDAKEKLAIAAVMVLSMAGIYVQFAQFAFNYLSLFRHQVASVRTEGARISGMEHTSFFAESYQVYATSSFENGPLYVICLEDGRQLLLRNSTPDESVLTLGFYNPFSYLLRRKPALGGSPFLLLGNSISSAYLLSDSRMFGNADLVMIPSYPSTHQESDAFLQKTYHSYLESHFAFVARSQWWALYRRKS